MGHFRLQEVCWGSCHLLSLLSFHKLSFLLFPFGPRLPSQAAQENPKFLSLLYAEQFDSCVVPLSPSKPGPFTLRGHQDIFLNKEPAYVNCKYGDFLRLGLQPWSVCAWPKALAWLCSCRKPAGTQTSIRAADKDHYLATLWSSYA